MWDQHNLVEPMFKIVDTILISTNEKILFWKECVASTFQHLCRDTNAQLPINVNNLKLWGQHNLVEPMFKIVDTILISTNEKNCVGKSVLLVLFNI
jgi:hypothetical protein